MVGHVGNAEKMTIFLRLFFEIILVVEPQMGFQCYPKTLNDKPNFFFRAGAGVFVSNFFGGKPKPKPKHCFWQGQGQEPWFFLEPREEPYFFQARAYGRALIFLPGGPDKIHLG